MAEENRWIDMKSKSSGVGKASTMKINVADDGEGNSHTYRILMEEGQAPHFGVRKTENGVELEVHGEWEMRELASFLTEYGKYLARQRI